MRNRFGLSRNIPADIALEVRRRSKFGCVVCRSAIYQYEHIDPEFADAQVHDPERICLLCGGCHDRVSRGRLAKQTVATHYQSVQQTVAIRRPFEQLDLSTNDISVELGSCSFEYAHDLIHINGRNLLSITPPKDGAAFPTLNGIFCDHQGKESFRITDNVWEGPLHAWDIQVIGENVTIKTEKGRTALVFGISPPNRVKIKFLDMYLENCHLHCDDFGLLLGQNFGNGFVYFGIGRFSCKGAQIGVSIDSRGKSITKYPGLSIVGGEGISLEGTGIRLGIGAGSMNPGDIRIWTV